MKIELVMDHSSLRGGRSEIDLERGDTESEDIGDEIPKLSGTSSKKQLYRGSRGCRGVQLPDTSEKGGKRFISQCTGSSFDASFVKNEEKLQGKVKEQIACLAEKKMVCKYPKRPESTRSSKPPRPPRGPSLDAADLMLVKEISELAILKRKRIERMQTLHKVKKGKASSMNSSLFAMVVTVIFFIVIIFQASNPGKGQGVQGLLR